MRGSFLGEFSAVQIFAVDRNVGQHLISLAFNGSAFFSQLRSQVWIGLRGAFWMVKVRQSPWSLHWMSWDFSLLSPVWWWRHQFFYNINHSAWSQIPKFLKLGTGWISADLLGVGLSWVPSSCFLSTGGTIGKSRPRAHFKVENYSLGSQRWYYGVLKKTSPRSRIKSRETMPLLELKYTQFRTFSFYQIAFKVERENGKSRARDPPAHYNHLTL